MSLPFGCNCETEPPVCCFTENVQNLACRTSSNSNGSESDTAEIVDIPPPTSIISSSPEKEPSDVTGQDDQPTTSTNTDAPVSGSITHLDSTQYSFNSSMSTGKCHTFL